MTLPERACLTEPDNTGTPSSTSTAACTCHGDIGSFAVVSASTTTFRIVPGL
jgi:hypothetical protein